MRIPTITLVLLAAALSGSAGARLATVTGTSKAPTPTPAYLAAKDYGGEDIQKRLLGFDTSSIITCEYLSFALPFGEWEP